MKTDLNSVEELRKAQELIIDVMARAQKHAYEPITYEKSTRPECVIENGVRVYITTVLSQSLVGFLMDWDPDPTMAAVTEAYKELKHLHANAEGMSPQEFNYCVLEWLAREYGIR